MKPMRTNRIIITVLSFTLLLSCDKGKENKRTEAIELNNKAMDIYLKYAHSSEFDIDSLEKAINFLEKAIYTDSTFQTAYTNKVNVHLKMKQYNEAIATLEKLLIQPVKNADIIVLQANLYEKIGMNDLADIKYKEALKIYNKQIENDPKNPEHKAVRAFLLLFTEGKDAAMEEIQLLLKENPDNQLVIDMEQTIRYFDRKTYINDL